MKLALLDTDVLSAFLRGNPVVAKNAERYLKYHNQLAFSVVTYYEIVNGLLYKDAKNQLQKFRNFAALCAIIPLTLDTAYQAATVFADLRKKGTPIGHTDCLIAGTALLTIWF